MTNPFRKENFQKITTPSLITIFVIGVILFILLYYNEIDFGITEIMAYLTGATAILTLIHFSISIDKTEESHLEMVLIKKNQYSFNIITEGHKSGISNALAVFRRIREDTNTGFSKSNITMFLDYLEKNPEDKIQIIRLLNYFEHISILIKKKHVDEEIIKLSYKTLFIKAFNIMKFYIEYTRKENHATWKEYEEVVKSWGKE